MSREDVPGYFDIFRRNIGIFTRDEQLKIKNSTVLIAGVGGVCGPSALTLARMGVGRPFLRTKSSIRRR
jgi:molybdopterin/thiamine biosynthesis adenylyltransferase